MEKNQEKQDDNETEKTWCFDDNSNKKKWGKRIGIYERRKFGRKLRV